MAGGSHSTWRVAEPAEQAALVRLQRSGLFDGAWFAARNPDLAGLGHFALLHWHRQGWREDRWPNPYFDTAYYRARTPDPGQDPLLHYVLAGEAAGQRPVPYFDPAWYRTRHDIPAGQLCLAHYLARRHGGSVSPIPEFDAAFYLGQYPDVATAGMDPLEHYMVRGASEGRLPCAGFKPGRHGGVHANPLLSLLLWREQKALPGAPSVASEVRRNTSPHPELEEARPLPPGLPPRAMLLAYYLPQFHPVPENDAWWGRGFTEWTNLGRALPRFAGHCQPRIPRDLGHYRLGGGEILRQQAALARGAGIHGFVFYFYWFNGRRLLEAPLEALLADPALDLPFCLMWANENWTRRWDGSDDEVLLSQDYRVRDEPALVATFMRYFADRRYIRLQGRPVLMVYRAQIIPGAAATVGRWRRLFRAAGEDPVFVMGQTFGETDPRGFGMDAAVEFPPHKVTAGLPLINKSLQVIDPEFDAEVIAYAAVARVSAAEPAPAFPLIKTAVPGWDNEPRRQGGGTVLHGATPALYQAWLEDLIRFAQSHPVFGAPMVCINAWNEWAEGATLEPDVHWGAAFLNATARAVSGLPAPCAGTRILLVGHDALHHGAQRLLLDIGKALRAVHGVQPAFLLLSGGPMEPEYAALAPTTVLRPDADLDGAVRAARAAGCDAAIVNTAASASALPALSRHGLRSILLVHELPRLLREKRLLEPLDSAIAVADAAVFPAGMVRDRCLEQLRNRPGRSVILPQGVNFFGEAGLPARHEQAAALRAALHVPCGSLLALGMGYADLRKGFDLFLQAWRAAQAARLPMVFAWAGGIDPALEEHLAGEVAAAEATGSFRFLGRRDDAPGLLAAADVFLLTSREDPLPSVALEAMASGTPVVAFEECGGVPDLLLRFRAGRSVALADTQAMVLAAAGLARAAPAGRPALAARCRAAFRFESYSAALLGLVRPDLPTISVVVPGCDYARFMQARLASIFAQTHPVTEVIVLDDASTDDSVAVARQTAAAWGRQIQVVERASRSGSAFRQWQAGAELAKGDWLWIAEADDAADPALLSALACAAAGARDATFAFCDSRAVDAQGAMLRPDHKRYYGTGHLDTDAVFEGRGFLRDHLAERNLILNVSAVLWRRADLLAALAQCAGDLAALRCAGDWRVYAQALTREGAQVAYVARPLNDHRRHGGSITARTAPADHLAEIGRVHAAIARLAGPDPALRRRQRRYRLSLAAPEAEKVGK